MIAEQPDPQDPTPWTWIKDQFNYLNVHFTAEVGNYGKSGLSLVHAYIAPRPGHCDRGRWIFQIDGIASIDGADSFPRYYMDLDVAKREAEAWLRWRLWRQVR